MIKFFLLFSLFAPIAVFSQKHDYVWVTGDDNNLIDTTYGGSTIDFNSTPALAYYNYRKLNLFTTNSSICDSSGHLLFYTNGCAIAGTDDAVLENGDDLNPGNAHALWCDQYADGYAGGPQNAVILPMPDSTGVYYLVHKSFTLYPNNEAIADKLMYSVIDMRWKNGKGKVSQKNILMMADQFAFGEMIAVKHANGKDWWFITSRKDRNTFYTFKLSAEGFSDTLQQTIGILPDTKGESLGQMVFSPDGSKLYRTNRFNPVMVYSFDREAGVFTQFDTIHYEYGNQLVGEIGCAVSPSGQFLYLACRKLLYQLDLWAPDISASQTVVAEWDGFATPIPTLFWQLQLAPDCKIYGLGGGDTRYFHIIHHPDEPGLNCNVEQHGLILPTRSGGSMPSFPNYRLGPLDHPGLPCAPVVSTQSPPTPLPAFSVFPNPMGAVLKLIPNRQYNGPARFHLFDVAGQVVREVVFDLRATCTEIDVQALPAGVYFYAVWCEGRMLRAGKVFKVE